MGGASPLTIERVLHESEPDVGFFEEIPVPLFSWRLGSGADFAAATTNIVGYAAVETTLMALRWDPGADDSDTIRLEWCLPGQFKAQTNGGNGENAQPQLILRVKARVFDNTGSATANTNLAFNCQCYWHKDGATAQSTLATVATVVIGATDYIAAEEEGFVWFDLDITGAMTAAQLAAIDGSESISIVLGPNETVGTNLYVDLIATKIKYLRHASLSPKTLRA